MSLSSTPSKHQKLGEFTRDQNLSVRPETTDETNLNDSGNQPVDEVLHAAAQPLRKVRRDVLHLRDAALEFR